MRAVETAAASPFRAHRWDFQLVDGLTDVYNILIADGVLTGKYLSVFPDSDSSIVDLCVAAPLRARARLSSSAHALHLVLSHPTLRVCTRSQVLIR